MNYIQRIVSSSTAVFVICLLAVVFCVTDLHAAVVATLRGVTGQVDILANGQLPAKAAKNGDQISSGDLVRTKSASTAEVVYSDGTVLRVAQRSRIDIGEHFSGKSPNSSEVRLTRGKVQAIVDLNAIKAPGAKKFEVRTPNAIAGVRGTDYIVAHDKALTSVLVNSGEVYVYNLLKTGELVNLTPGMITTVYGRNKPAPPRPASESDTKRMQSSSAGKTNGGSSSDVTSLAGDTSQLPGQSTTGGTASALDNVTKAATQGVSATAAAPPPPPPPPPSVRTGSIGATWTPAAKPGSVTATW